jgi:hypothetical protein
MTGRSISSLRRYEVICFQRARRTTPVEACWTELRIPKPGLVPEQVVRHPAGPRAAASMAIEGTLWRSFSAICPRSFSVRGATSPAGGGSGRRVRSFEERMKKLQVRRACSRLHRMTRRPYTSAIGLHIRTIQCMIFLRDVARGQYPAARFTPCPVAGGSVRP